MYPSERLEPREGSLDRAGMFAEASELMGGGDPVFRGLTPGNPSAAAKSVQEPHDHAEIEWSQPVLPDVGPDDIGDRRAVAHRWSPPPGCSPASSASRSEFSPVSPWNAAQNLAPRFL